jgi:hypothetical protein
MMFREIRARKAKFGFEYGCIRLADVEPLSEFLKSLKSQFEPDKYTAEESGYNEPVLKFYTDHGDVANWIRNYTP